MFVDQFNNWLPYATRYASYYLAASFGVFAISMAFTLYIDRKIYEFRVEINGPNPRYAIWHSARMVLWWCLFGLSTPTSLTFLWLGAVIPYDWLVPFTAPILGIMNDNIPSWSVKGFFYIFSILFLVRSGLPWILLAISLLLDIFLTHLERGSNIDFVKVISLFWGLNQVAIMFLFLDPQQKDKVVGYLAALWYLALLSREAVIQFRVVPHLRDLVDQENYRTS